MKNRRAAYQRFKSSEKIIIAFFTQKLDNLAHEVEILKNSLIEKENNKTTLTTQKSRVIALEKLNKELQISINQLIVSNKNLKNTYHQIMSPIVEKEYLHIYHKYIGHGNPNNCKNPYEDYEK